MVGCGLQAAYPSEAGYAGARGDNRVTILRLEDRRALCGYPEATFAAFTQR